MRIIAGTLKGRNLTMPRGIRPTSQKTKEALFNILGERVIDQTVLDLFAGSGSLGIEALSRGAKRAVFVDNNKNCVQTIKANLEICGLNKGENKGTGISVLSMDALRAIKVFGRKGKRFNVIFLDPPYYKDMAKKALLNLAGCDILGASGIVIIEHYKKDILPALAGTARAGSLCLTRQSCYGDTMVSIYEQEKGSLSR